MQHLHLFSLLLAACAAFLAGAINSVAGGGTMVTFPTLMFLGLPPIVANATSTVAIWPGSLGSIWGFRQELGRTDRTLRALVIPSLLGGGIGAYLLRHTASATFEHMVPFLIFFATALFMVQGGIQRRLAGANKEAAHGIGGKLGLALACQLLIGIYGGYFGAGVSIVMLSALSAFGQTDILEMSALTSLFSLCINGVAVLVFVAAGLVDWPYVLAMALCAVAGGILAAGIARRIGRPAVRRFVITVGLTMTVVFVLRQWVWHAM
ncbi:MAG: sulfite exporter TauE/SafE family protein [Paludibacterium sp.]|uniref:sulfite exporter TauE/SafE family protein n=1 Tax=Paludibacterium sp. TaxID=1917523 RepID=UPI0025EC4D87|nr:sulfite exporter TauE/SafE family protein [Paludibacterium sp.]MBV8046762.1 sulfite exporter TauE/SafE family protein [Paludibacterium sp.]MBV8649571.1 sulfite exporter TauE/SafE family protein [Paludibacterium sp.]